MTCIRGLCVAANQKISTRTYCINEGSQDGHRDGSHQRPASQSQRFLMAWQDVARARSDVELDLDRTEASAFGDEKAQLV
jgi:hypothetical protein